MDNFFLLTMDRFLWPFSNIGQKRIFGLNSSRGGKGWSRPLKSGLSRNFYDLSTPSKKFFFLPRVSIFIIFLPFYLISFLSCLFLSTFSFSFLLILFFISIFLSLSLSFWVLYYSLFLHLHFWDFIFFLNKKICILLW